MRGSVYYQSAELTKVIFQEGAKKYEKVNPNHEYSNKVSSYKTMESYRNVWNNFFNYLLEHWELKDCEKLEAYHVEAYMNYKIEYYPSKQYIQKISAALGKLEMALVYFTKQKYGTPKQYDFSIRQQIVDTARDYELLVNNYHNRAYKNPEMLISTLNSYMHRLAASIEYEGGARIEACSLIKNNQLLGFVEDEVTGIKKGKIFTKEKGGKEGPIYISVETYRELNSYISQYEVFKINRQKYYLELRKVCQALKSSSEGTHGLRWNFAQRRLSEYIKYGYTYEQSLQAVSWEMKHNRASITEHYLGR